MTLTQHADSATYYDDSLDAYLAQQYPMLYSSAFGYPTSTVGHVNMGLDTAVTETLHSPLPSSSWASEHPLHSEHAGYSRPSSPSEPAFIRPDDFEAYVERMQRPVDEPLPMDGPFFRFYGASTEPWRHIEGLDAPIGDQFRTWEAAPSVQVSPSFPSPGSIEEHDYVPSFSAPSGYLHSSVAYNPAETSPTGWSDVEAAASGASGASGSPTAVGPHSHTASPNNQGEGAPPPPRRSTRLAKSACLNYNEDSEDEQADCAAGSKGQAETVPFSSRKRKLSSASSDARPSKRVSTIKDSAADESTTANSKQQLVCCGYAYAGPHKGKVCTAVSRGVENHKRHLNLHALQEVIWIYLGLLDVQTAPLLSGAAIGGTPWKFRFARCPTCDRVFKRPSSLFRHTDKFHKQRNAEVVALKVQEGNVINKRWRAFDIEDLGDDFNLKPVAPYRMLAAGDKAPPMLEIKQPCLHPAERWWIQWYGPYRKLDERARRRISGILNGELPRTKHLQCKAPKGSRSRRSAVKKSS